MTRKEMTAMDDAEIFRAQRALCTRVGSPLLAVGGNEKMGVSRSALDVANWPLKGVRHRPEAGTCGWYVFAGTYSEDPNFYQPMHAQHLLDVRPEVAEYLGMSPGWAFVIAPGYEDVWQDDDFLE
jgi:hypothetical protein